MEKELSKQILTSTAGIIDKSDGYQVSYDVNTEVVVSHFPKSIAEITTITIILNKKL